MKLKELNLGKLHSMRTACQIKNLIWQKEWEEVKLYQRRQGIEPRTAFLPVVGPPYATEISTLDTLKTSF